MWQEHIHPNRSTLVRDKHHVSYQRSALSIRVLVASTRWRYSPDTEDLWSVNGAHLSLLPPTHVSWGEAEQINIYRLNMACKTLQGGGEKKDVWVYVFRRCVWEGRSRYHPDLRWFQSESLFCQRGLQMLDSILPALGSGFKINK